MYKKLWGEGKTPKASSESEPDRRPPPSTAVGDPASLLTNRESIARSHSRSGAASATFRRVLVPPCPRPPQVPPIGRRVRFHHQPLLSDAIAPRASSGAHSVLMNILPTRGVIEQGVCLDALIAIMLDSSANQMDFEAFHGIEEVAELVRDKQVDENLRWSHKSSCDIWSLSSKVALPDQIRVLHHHAKPWGNGWCRGGEGVPKEAV